ncbi:Endonuclease YncB, thermonuclease family [Formivibrio citricus]|uniref:Endonuclease YncB, thermonuclease family n=1 Tax=Formivibrio citricus TaxID=83765 RepID=A0A1I4WB89_9NEIS|nr:thermonuclease family protein [Formivibrio citricus]SFN10623.1 Endonuclease YncB, thermonuclease family [Formivibrio citricus]
MNLRTGLWKTSLLLAASLVLPLQVHARTLHGTVIGISDGDTLTLLSNQRQHKVRLAQIDAPEKDQPYGQRAKRSLSDLAYRREARVEVEAEDKYGRTVGTIWINGRNINEEQLRRGMAWVYTQYAHSPELLTIQQEARQAQRGLWADANPTPPWKWRHTRPSASHSQWGWLSWLKFWKSGHKQSKPAPIREGLSTPQQCGAKQYCKEMTSCEEARFYLEQCGLKQLDGNGDGVPCEALCR